MEAFETLLARHGAAAERFVRYRLPVREDAEDVLQDTFLLAYQKFSTLRDAERFKPWLLSIARNRCNDYYRARTRGRDVPLDSVNEGLLADGRMGVGEGGPVLEALDALPPGEKTILTLFYLRRLPQADIARQLGIPLGTVKSRLHTARLRLRAGYAAPGANTKGEKTMKTMPEKLPDYTILRTETPPFSVCWEELMGWFIIPRLGEQCTWGMYDMPSRKIDHSYTLQVIAPAEVHGVPGVEITARESPESEKADTMERTFVAQVTDAHCRYLAALRTEGGIRRYITFLDEEAFFPTWGFGENNCGNETHLSARGKMIRRGAEVTCADEPFLTELVDRCTVTIAGRTYDTVCLMIAESPQAEVISEQYLDSRGRTILWRRFNRDDWAMERYGKPWTEALPNNERITFNGRVYVHWYDCITDYIL